MSGVHVRVRVGAEDYALPVEDVLEVTELGHVTPLPGAGAGVLGVRNLRGQVIPILDLATLLDVDRTRSPERIVVAVDGDRRAGLAVDAVVDVEVVGEASEAVESPLLSGAVLIDDALVGVVDVRALLRAQAPEAQR